MLRHVRNSGVYWFCPHCYQEMPNLETLVKSGGLLIARDWSRFSYARKEKVLAVAS